MISTSRLERSAEGPRWKSYLLLAGIATLALVLRLHLLGQNSLWLDEGVSAGIAQLTWSDFFKLLWRREANMSFYYLLLRGWTHFGEGEFVLRLLSVITGVLSVLAVYLLGSRLFSVQSGLIAALLLALNAFHVRHSQEARGYTLLILLLTLSGYYFVRVLDAPDTKNRKRYIAASVVAFYTHFYAILAIAAQFISLFFYRRDIIPKIQLRTCARWMIALAMPGIVFMFFKQHGRLDWIPATTVQWLYHSVMLFTGQQGVWLVLAYCVMCGFAFSTSEARKHWPSWFVASWLLVPPGILLTVSTFKPLFVPRYIAMCLPALALLSSAGLGQLRRGWRIAGLAVLVVLSCLGLRNYYRDFPGENSEWRTLTQFVMSNADKGDQVIFDNGLARPLFEYYRAGNTQWPQVLFPAHGATMTYRDFEGVATPDLLASAERYPRIWFITWKPSGSLQEVLAKRFEKREERQFRGATVQLYERRSK